MYMSEHPREASIYGCIPSGAPPRRHLRRGGHGVARGEGPRHVLIVSDSTNISITTTTTTTATNNKHNNTTNNNDTISTTITTADHTNIKHTTTNDNTANNNKHSKS